MAFHNVQFPSNISYGSRGGPGFRTQIISLDSGQERRVSRWSQARHGYDAAYGVREHEDLAALKRFYMARQGAAYSFRYKDWSDFRTTESGIHPNQGGEAIAADDQLVEVGDGATTAFQLVKRYTDGSVTRIRTITKPVASTVLVALDGVAASSGWSVDETTGILTFSVAPSDGVDISWGGEFDVHARFGESSDEILSATIDDFGSGSIPSIEIVEIVNGDSVTDEFYFGGSHVATLSNSLSLSESVGRVYSLDPDGSDRDLNLPVPDSETPSGGPWFYIHNSGSSGNLRLMAGNAIIDTVAIGELKQVLLSVDSGSYQWLVM